MDNVSQITIPTDLLAAVAKWASDDQTRGIRAVVFRNGEIVATDGQRMCRVPMNVTGIEVTGTPHFGVCRRDILAAIAAQDVLARDGIDPPIDHDVDANLAGDTVLTDGPYGGRTVKLRHEDKYVSVSIGDIEIRAEAMDLNLFPAPKALDDVMPRARGESPPDGIIFQPRFLAAIDEVTTSAWARHGGVRVTGWGGRLSPVLFETKNGVRMAIMPMRQFQDQTP